MPPRALTSQRGRRQIFHQHCLAARAEGSGNRDDDGFLSMVSPMWQLDFLRRRGWFTEIVFLFAEHFLKPLVDYVTDLNILEGGSVIVCDGCPDLAKRIFRKESAPQWDGAALSVTPLGHCDPGGADVFRDPPVIPVAPSVAPGHSSRRDADAGNCWTVGEGLFLIRAMWFQIAVTQVRFTTSVESGVLGKELRGAMAFDGSPRRHDWALFDACVSLAPR